MAAVLASSTGQDRPKGNNETTSSQDRQPSLPTTSPPPAATAALTARPGDRSGSSPNGNTQDGSARPAPASAAPAPALSRSSTPVPDVVPLSAAGRRGSKLSRGTAVTARDDDALRGSSNNASQLLSTSPGNPYIDPLSQHIFMKAVEQSKSSRLRPSRPDSPALDSLPQPHVESFPKLPAFAADAGKEKKKGILGRLSMIGNKKKDGFDDNASEFGGSRTEGSNAAVFASFVGSGGFIPIHKEPPRYIRVKSHDKKVREFDRMFLAQELVGTRPPEAATDDKTPLVTISTATQGRRRAATGGAVWATEFSKDGRYLAAGGRDHVVRIWSVIATQEDRRAQEEEEATNGGAAGTRLSAPVFVEKPVHEFRGHTGEILDLSWSKNNFILSTSMDKTVRLWHISREECLCAFQHKELVSKVAFHPRDDRFFLAGCLDAVLRLWSIPDKSIAYSAQLPDMITAVAFSPDGSASMAGLLNGYCHFFETEGLKPQTQIHVRSSRGKNAKGSKITGIVTMVPPDAKDAGDAKVLITSTDSRVRIYNLRDKTVDLKFKDHEHTSSQLCASFSDDGKYVICGSEDRKAFIWSTAPTESPLAKDKRPCECFDAHADMVTTAIFAPTKTRQLLGSSGDPIYDLCNPPAVTLMSVEESIASHSGLSDHQAGGVEIEGAPLKPPRPEESPAYVARSTHYDGNIIVTSDDTGIIKVFRQDCAANKRKHESWETGSTFSRKLTAVGRSGSIITRNSTSSAATHSRRGSLTQVPMLAASGTSLGGHSSTSSSAVGNSDRIISWRQGIEGNSRPGSLVGVIPARTDRSISPSKTPRISQPALATFASEARKQPYAAAAASPLSATFVNSQGGPNTQIRGGLLASPVANNNNNSSNNNNNNNNNTISSGGQDGASTAAAAAALKRPKSAAANMAVSRNQNQYQRRASMETEARRPVSRPVTRHESQAKTSEEVNPQRFGPPEPSFSFKPSVEDDLRLDTAGSSYGFWNFSKWKGISGLRALTGGGGGGGGTSSGSSADGPSHAPRPSEGHDTATAVVGHQRQRSLASSILPKSPLSKSETVPTTTVLTVVPTAVPTTPTATTTARNSSDIDDAAIRAAVAAAVAATAGSRAITRENSTNGKPQTPERSANTHRKSTASGVSDSHFMATPTFRSPIDDSSSVIIHQTLLSPTRERSPYSRGSIVSRLSSELTSSDGEGDADADTEEMRCTKCGGREFKARRVGTHQRLQCNRCGRVIDEAAAGASAALLGGGVRLGGSGAGSAALSGGGVSLGGSVRIGGSHARSK